MRILLIEDDAALADALGEALGRRGLAIDHARDIDEAEAFLAALDHAAVLLDLGLPDGDGRTCCGGCARAATCGRCWR